MNTEFGGAGFRSIENLESKHTFPADKVRWSSELKSWSERDGDFIAPYQKVW